MQNELKPNKTVDLFECLTDKEKAKGKRKGIRMAKIEKFFFKIKNLFKQNNLKPCPNCKANNIKKVHSLSSYLPWWWHIECFDCHWCGKTKLFLRRAIKSWNKESGNNND